MIDTRKKQYLTKYMYVIEDETHYISHCPVYLYFRDNHLTNFLKLTQSL